jgi:hypothetical protein
MYYSVGNRTFTNKFLAGSYAGKNNTPMHFNMYESAFDRADWTKEPTESWDYLLDIRAQQIAAKGLPIVLNFSGGTDSLTIYEVFKRNNIHIDIIYTRARVGVNDRSSYSPVYEFLNKGIYDKTTKVVIREDSEELFNELYPNKDWIWDTAQRYQFAMAQESFEYASRALGTDNFISIIGLEKPRLEFTDTGVYSYQDDENYVRPMNDSTLDCFYISPDLPKLHVKQSYMLLNYIKSLAPNSSTSDLKKFNTVHQPLKFNWFDYSINGCGRYGDLNDSANQHAGNALSKFIIPQQEQFTGTEYQGRGSDWYASLSGTLAFKNYTQGLLNVVKDSAGKFLQLNPGNFYSIRQFRSKYYQLNFNNLLR